MWYVTLDMWQVGKTFLKIVWNTGHGKHQGSTKLLYMLSEKTETHISHGKFSLKIMYNIKKGYLCQRKILFKHKTETNFLHKKNLRQRNKFPSQKQFFSDFMSEKPTSVTEKSFFIENFVCNWVKLLSKKKRKFIKPYI